ncbi:nck-associated protein 5-like isoform X1 [Osmerus eperlanus]|uniref:nck-associated protein 5-like isoform X1 n=2 Tax=Osmerus eperlanus TaxID=29151 RepID=UPI002E0DB14C
MSDAETREGDEAFESEEGDVEPYLEETEGSRDILDRVRELEAENSALALATESQREAYERCLDEVANHVVQALLNQKDLREECIKLKMRVFDLERQNRTLTELFAQKLHPQSTSLQQMPLVSVSEHSTDESSMGSDKLLTAQSQGELKSNGDRTHNGTAGSAQASATSMEALSPFFKKKAHILEVLRKLEESDPLKFHPSSCLSSHHDLGQALVSMEMGSLMSSGSVSSPQRPSARCRHSSSDSDIHEYANGEGEELRQHHQGGCQSCRMLSQKSSLDSLLKCAQGHGAAYSGRGDGLRRQAWIESQGASALNTGAPQTAALQSVDSKSQRYVPNTEQPDTQGSDPFLPSLIQVSGLNGQESKKILTHPKIHPSSKLPLRGEHHSSLSEDVKHMDLQSQNGDQSEESCYLEEEATEAHNLQNSLHTSETNLDIAATASSQPGYQEQEVSEQVCNRLYFSSNETSVSKKVAVESYSPAPVPERTSSAQAQPGPKSKLAQSPTSPSSTSGLGEVKPSPISSPSRLLKFLKIPTIGERTQAGGVLRLSPQLTRSSKIPCRNNNNYEVYQSPVLGRKATTTERDKHPSSSPPKVQAYPATHSAPTSPPQPEDNVCPLPPVKEIAYSSHSAPKHRGNTKAPFSSSQPQRGSQKVPHYENVCPSDGTSQYLPCTQNEGPVEKSFQQDEKLLSPPSQHTDSSPGSEEPFSDLDPSDQDTDSESPVWHKPHQHFSLPASSSATSSKAHKGSSYSSERNRNQERSVPQYSQPNCDPPNLPTSAAKRGEPLPGSSTPKRPGFGQGKHQSESSHHPFKERLAALGKLKSTEDLPEVPPQSADKRDAQCNRGSPPTTNNNSQKSKTAERQGERSGIENRHQKYTDSLDGKPYPKTSLGSHPRHPGPFTEVGAKSSATPSPISKGEQDTFTPRIYVAKAEGPKIKMGMSATNTEPPSAMRSYGKCPITQSQHSKTVPSPQNSPSKITSKSPSKAGQASSYPRGIKPTHEDRTHATRHPPRPEDKSKLTPGKKKTSIHAESFLPPPPLPPRSSAEAIANEDKKSSSSAPATQQSAIEQKVMRGIEENMMKLQEQDRCQVTETKQKASNGIASWFGLRKSKLPALSRKPEMSKQKTNMSPPSATATESKDGKGPRKVVESLNISKLMEKAEDLRKALEEERAYVNGVSVAMERAGRGHSCEVVMDQAQGQVSLMYRGVTADNFMQQLLNSPSTSCSGNRVDERGVASLGMAHRRLSFDLKSSRPIFSNQRNGVSHTKSRDEIDKSSEMVGKDEVTSDESLAESISSQHFTGSGASMRTLDSGIGTFPMPDYASSATGKSIPKGKLQGEQGFSGSQGKHGAPMKVPRKARTLERELSSLDEVTPSVLYGSGMEDKAPNMHLSSTIHEDIDAYSAHLQNPPSKNWTFPNLKCPTGTTDVFLDVQGEPGCHGTPSRRSLKPCTPQTPLTADPGSLPLPPQTGLSRRGKGRTPSAPEVGKDGGLELLKERPEDILSPSRPQALETPESLSDSLYDSLSSCGSQG